MNEQPSSLRLFLALWPDDTVRAQLRAARDAWTWPRGATPVHTDKLHLTLHFLGSVAAERLPELRAGLLHLPMTPFDLRLGRPESWHGGIAVLAPLEEPPALLALHAELAQALAALGMAPERRPYRPHVTMARRADGVALPAQDPVIDWHVDRYALVESRPDAGYIVLHDDA